MAVNQYGKGHIHGLSGAALGVASLSGYVSPNLQSLRLSHKGKIDEIEGQIGEVTGFIATDDAVECDFDYIPEGSSIANAKLSAGIATNGAPHTITGLPIIAVGRFTDVFNTNGANTQPWFYMGDADVNGPHETKWTARIRLKRYINITSGTPIT
jgi:hypothetical protein